MLILAVICIIVAVYAALCRDAPIAAAGTVGAVLFALLAIITGKKDQRDAETAVIDRVLGSRPRPHRRGFFVPKPTSGLSFPQGKV
jgi:hypothetical protein